MYKIIINLSEKYSDILLKIEKYLNIRSSIYLTILLNVAASQ